MRITDPMKRFIKEHEEDINLNNWGKIYESLNTNFYILTGEFTALMYEAGLNPLTGLDYIPNSFYTSQDIKNFYVPDGIVEIGPFAFSSTLLDNISIPNTVKRIDTYAFLNCLHLGTIEYRGKKEDFLKTFSDSIWFPHNNTVIKCIDGEVKIKNIKGNLG